MRTTVRSARTDLGFLCAGAHAAVDVDPAARSMRARRSALRTNCRDEVADRPTIVNLGGVGDRDLAREVDQYAETRDAMRQAVDGSSPIVRRKHERRTWRRVLGRGVDEGTSSRPDRRDLRESPLPDGAGTRAAPMTYDEAVEYRLRLVNEAKNTPRKT